MHSQLGIQTRNPKLEPDSLLLAAKKLASVSRLSWSRVRSTYQDLQARGEIPVSRGRNIQAATPQLITRLIIALAVRQDKGTAYEDYLAQQFATATLDGTGLD